jgi:hypothetical protein
MLTVKFFHQLATEGLLDMRRNGCTGKKVINLYA